MNHPNTCECCRQRPCLCEIEYATYKIYALSLERMDADKKKSEQDRLDMLVERAGQRGLHRSAP